PRTHTSSSQRSTIYCTNLFSSNHIPPPHIYPLSLHDALPISRRNHAARADAEGRDVALRWRGQQPRQPREVCRRARGILREADRSEEHTSELQSLRHLVCRLLLEKKKKKQQTNII